jgi:hypothetical protein
MLETQNFLTPEELSFGIRCVNEILLDDQDDGDARYWLLSHAVFTDSDHPLKRSGLGPTVNRLLFHAQATARANFTTSICPIARSGPSAGFKHGKNEVLADSYNASPTMRSSRTVRGSGHTSHDETGSSFHSVDISP